ncbi:MAG: bifunctional diaminohydroxyphosphoribosylaminopyrimidine deaminase/5-amino-6-(5-phosphoribosylamino)uracil reductase RibD [bacterium]|nr:MAG: bifunctional diaminohydroxyphosphoribosylaminopyrimidine deaminase/5-amino-6-(5-phosphoribosylamino)uracil reductase RibD [bacterium]
MKELLHNDEGYMRRALELARRPAGPTYPNPRVGAVIVSDGEIIGEGYHRAVGLPHAEIEAITMAGDRVRGSTIYLNLEPCCHYGRTPPCTDAIREAGIARVVFGIYDPDERVRGRGAGILKGEGIDVCAGVLERDALELNLPYIHRSVTGRCFVMLKLASTLDGRLTAVGRRWLTGSPARARVHDLRAQTEAIAVGIGTLIDDRPRLDRRLHEEELPPPVRMVFDPQLRFPLDYPWLVDGERVIIYAVRNADPGRRHALEAANAEVVILPEKDGLVDLTHWIEEISSRGFTSVMVEGGGRIATSILREGCFERLVLFYAPVISGQGGVLWFGDRKEPPWFENGGLVLERQELIGDDVMAVYDRSHIDRYLELVTGGDRLVHRTD